MTDKTVSGAEYHEDLAENWSMGYASGGFQHRLNLIRSTLKELVVSGSNWLDAGCGTGLLTRELTAMGASAIGVDASPKMIAAAHSESLPDSQLTFQKVVSVENIEFPSYKFDGILCSSVVEYVDSPGAVFGEFSRLLKPGGKLLISVPNKYSLVRRMQKLCKLIVSWFGGNIFAYLNVSKCEFTHRDIEDSLNKVGFFIDKVEFFDPILPKLMSDFGMGSLIVISARLDNAS